MIFWFLAIFTLSSLSSLFFSLSERPQKDRIENQTQKVVSAHLGLKRLFSLFRLFNPIFLGRWGLGVGRRGRG